MRPFGDAPTPAGPPSAAIPMVVMGSATPGQGSTNSPAPHSSVPPATAASGVERFEIEVGGHVSGEVHEEEAQTQCGCEPVFRWCLGAVLVIAVVMSAGIAILNTDLDATIVLWWGLALLPGAAFVLGTYLPRHTEVEFGKMFYFALFGVLGTVVALGVEILLQLLGALVLLLIYSVVPSTDLLYVLADIFDSFVVAAGTEELMKWTLCWLVCFQLGCFRKRTPWGHMVIGLTAVMAFATLENLEYMTAMFINPHFLSSGLVLRHHRLRFLMGDVAQVELSDHTSSLIQTGIARALLSVPLHAYSAISYGSDGARILYDPQNPGSAKRVASRILHMMWLPVLIHGTFDFCLMLAALVPLSALVPLGLGVLVWGLIVYKILKLNALRRELNALPAPAHGDL